MLIEVKLMKMDDNNQLDQNMKKDDQQNEEQAVEECCRCQSWIIITLVRFHDLRLHVHTRWALEGGCPTAAYIYICIRICRSY